MSFFSISKNIIKENAYKASMSYVHSHKYYELYFQLDGTRTYFYNNKSYELSPNTLVVTKPNCLHKFENDSSFERILISAEADLFSKIQLDFLDSLAEKTLIKLAPDKMSAIIKILEDLLDYEKSVLPDKYVKIGLKLGFLFYQIEESTIGEIPPSHSLPQDYATMITAPTVLKIMDHIEKNYNKKIALNDLCKEYNLSRTWLCKCFLAANNMTIFQYKKMCQIQQAKKYLSAHPFSIEHISKLTGFSTPQQFIATFKKHTGVTPLVWRRKFFKKK